MYKVFSAMQRKDKDMSTGRYTHPTQEPEHFSHTQKHPWSLAAIFLVLIAIAVLVLLLL